MSTKPRIVGSLGRVAFGGDSPIPNWRDLSDFVKTMRWFLGRGPKPSFERWAYWEKIDVFGAMADIVIIGFTGLILWFPELVTSVLPGKTLNFAKVIHSTQALLATGFVFAIHFFNTHIRPDKFPMDLSMFVGLVSEEELREERADYYERLRREGRLEELQAVVPPRRFLRLVTFGGAIAVAIGMSLLVGIVVALVEA
jgi:cytochrome b subunit of formate dehydrogenase